MDQTEINTAGSVILIIFIIFWLAIPAVLAIQKGRNWFTWVTLALFLPLISLLILIMLPSHREPKPAKSEKPAKPTKVSLPAVKITSTEKRDSQIMTEPSGKKSYTEEFKKEVVHTALTAGTSLSEVARMYGVHLTLVRNWKEKYETEVLNESKAGSSERASSDIKLISPENDEEIPIPTLIWHIDRAKFSFSDPSEYKEWKKEKKVFFEFSPSNSDDGGEAVFADPDSAEDDFEITEDRGLVKITLEKDGPLITVWVGVTTEIVEDLDEETLNDWANDQGGWASCSIHMGEFDAFILEDDGGDWRFPAQGDD